MAFESLPISMLIFDVCYIFVTSDRAPGNCHFTATIACENITSVSPHSSPLGTLRAEESLRLSDRNSILMT